MSNQQTQTISAQQREGRRVGPGCPPWGNPAGSPPPESKCKARKPGAMPPRWLNVISSMIHGGMDFQAAMRSTGYSKAYYTTNGHNIKKDDRFCKAYAGALAESRAKTEGRRAKRMRDLDNIIENPDTLQRDRIGAIQLQGRMCGWLSETIRHETTERQNALDSANRQEAARLALLSLDTRTLPDVAHSRRFVQSVITDASDNEEIFS